MQACGFVNNTCSNFSSGHACWELNRVNFLHDVLARFCFHRAGCVCRSDLISTQVCLSLIGICFSDIQSCLAIRLWSRIFDLVWRKTHPSSKLVLLHALVTRLHVHFYLRIRVHQLLVVSWLLFRRTLERYKVMLLASDSAPCQIFVFLFALDNLSLFLGLSVAPWQKDLYAGWVIRFMIDEGLFSICVFFFGDFRPPLSGIYSKSPEKQKDKICFLSQKGCLFILKYVAQL